MTVHFQNVGGDPFQDQETLEAFLDALNEVADEVLIGDDEWPTDDYSIHDRPVTATGISLEEAEEIWAEFEDQSTALGGPVEKMHVEDFKLNEAELFALSEKTDDWEMQEGKFVTEGLEVHLEQADEGGNPGGNAPETGKQDLELQVFEVIGGEGNLQGETVGVGVDFPNSGVYVDWNNGAWPDDDQLDGPHVSDYDTVDDLVQATGNTVEELESFDTGFEPVAESSDTASEDAGTGDDEPGQKGSDSVTISGLSDEAVESIEGKYNVEVER